MASFKCAAVFFVFFSETYNTQHYVYHKSPSAYQHKRSSQPRSVAEGTGFSGPVRALTSAQQGCRVKTSREPFTAKTPLQARMVQKAL